MSKGDYSTKFRPDKLRELINAGKNAQEIMKELKISRLTLKEHLFLLQREDKKYYEIPGLLEEKEESKRIIRYRRGHICQPGTAYLPAFQTGHVMQLIEQEDRAVLKLKS